MLFHTEKYIIFIVLVFLFHWLILKPNNKIQNGFLLALSYYFYSCWDIRFLLLLMASTLLDFFIGSKISSAAKFKHKKFWLIVSIISNLGILLVFKYYNFFIETALDILQLFGITSNLSIISIILPVGISFYTFHGMSYVFDIYYRKITAEEDLLKYSLFVSFFPLLVAGPIERANHLLPQLSKNRHFTYSLTVMGLKQILWGYFKKIVIADNCGVVVDYTYLNHTSINTISILFGLICFSFQIYCDFSGYTDIAIGSGKLFGIELLRNFNFPYFAENIKEFWRRWHISLTAWFRDYVYIPLGGKSENNFLTIRNVLIVFLLSGIWHGANYTFIVWALLNFIFVIKLPLRNPFYTKFFNTNKYENKSIWNFIKIIRTFILITFIWVFFRSPTINVSFKIFSNILANLQKPINLSGDIIKTSAYLLFLIPFFTYIEWKGRNNDFAISNIFEEKHYILRWLSYGVLIYIIGMYMHTNISQFIYFQF